MRRFLLTSTKFTGQIELLYDEAGKIARIDMLQAELSYEQVAHFMRNLLPYNPQDFGLLPKTVTVIESAVDISFDDWWKHYRKKVNRKRCEVIWPKLTKSDQLKALMTLREYYKCLDRTGRKEVDPENYLKNAYWETDWKSIY